MNNLSQIRAVWSLLVRSCAVVLVDAMNEDDCDGDWAIKQR